LLNESEANVLHLTEQAAILKSEIRRLERNQERETSVSNMEYLKNIIYKFLTLKSGDEKIQLVPVIHTMLKFSPEEKQTISRLASGIEPGTSTSNVEGGSTWSAYLPKWPGIV
ncbi:hypothetical protein HELRODRAFT_78291, partial [Helobdella robusta]|uniref:GRIP domain-containing protein n=1 Tax=Helobdella robusta TaxID=6412 RepID=T1G3A2_HELRO